MNHTFIRLSKSKIKKKSLSSFKIDGRLKIITLLEKGKFIIPVMSVCHATKSTCFWLLGTHSLFKNSARLASV